jgi:hypothetical protein
VAEVKRGVGHPLKGSDVAVNTVPQRGARLVGKSAKLNDQDLSIVKG